MTEENPSKLLTLVTAFVRQKYRKYIFLWYYYLQQTFFYRKYKRMYYLRWLKKKKSSELLTLMMALVRRKYKTYIFYGVSICDKQSSIINIKKGIIYDDRRNTVGTINTCDCLCASKIQNIYFLWCYYLQQTLFHHKKKIKKNKKGY